MPFRLMSSICPLIVSEAKNPSAWDSFLTAQKFRPFLQSWTMGEVYRDTGQEPIRLEAREGQEILAICQAILVPAKRGRHLAIPYGPLLSSRLEAPASAEATAGRQSSKLVLDTLLRELTTVGKQHRCSFLRMSPFWTSPFPFSLPPFPRPLPSPLHLLAEHVWYLPLVDPDPWQRQTPPMGEVRRKTEDELLMAMRKTTRNLIRRAEKEGVEVIASSNPIKDIEIFLQLHEETRKRHRFTPYTNAFFRTQITRFAPRGEATLYLARYQGKVIASSLHMHIAGETSYHHGASSHAYAKIPASYLLQWTAIRDALKRGDAIYNFWGIAPPNNQPEEQLTLKARSSKLEAHPFAGVTLFKTGFGGNLLPLVHCMDFPLARTYTLTRAFEQLRRWHRGF